MTEVYLDDDDSNPLPDEFESIIGRSFGNGDYVRAVVESSRTTREKEEDTFIAIWCHSSQSESESLRQKHHRLKKIGKFLSGVLSGPRNLPAK